MRTRFLRSALVAVALTAGSAAASPDASDPIAPAWRAGEALAMMIKPQGEVLPIDERYLERTGPFRSRIVEAEGRDDLRRFDKVDPGGKRTWLFDGDDLVLFRVDTDADGKTDQSQYFGPEGLFAVVHHFSTGTRTQSIYWPVGEARIVEVRDDRPPYRGVWWRTTENPFPERGGSIPAPLESGLDGE